MVDAETELKLNLVGREFSDAAAKSVEEEKFVKKKVIAGVELSEETIDEIKEAFLEFDIDCDGTITTQVR